MAQQKIFQLFCTLSSLSTSLKTQSKCENKTLHNLKYIRMIKVSALNRIILPSPVNAPTGSSRVGF
uniref:Uncharacterized protein n=1 Tax=Rhizophagus irregularis (strain DAOM 181602 / DAOM 197198 / MUCL 43194) TaxID=747089 RepID=U9TFS1_RHIID